VAKVGDKVPEEIVRPERVAIFDSVAVATKVTGEPDSVAEVAVKVFEPVLDPKVHEPTVAMPEEFVVALPPVIDPPPVSTENVTLTPATGLLSASLIMTEGAVETLAPAMALWLSPVLIAI
jgi:hypothetical protein